MTDAPTPPAAAPVPKPNFEFGDAMSATFGTFFKRPFYFLAVATVGLVLTFLIAGLISLPSFIGLMELIESGGTPEDEVGLILALYIPFLVVMMLVGSFFLGIIARSAVTVRLGEGVQFGKAIKRGALGVLPLIGMGLVLLIPMYVGYLLLFVPGLYLGAMFSLILPIVVFEEKGFGALGRSISLTRGYRWVLIGFNLVIGIVATMISYVVLLVASLATFPVIALATEGDGGVIAVIIVGIVAAILFVAGYAAVIALPYIAAGVAYVRLREIKDGGGDEILKVFE